MAKIKKDNLLEIILKSHAESIEVAIETSIRTGVPLVIEKDGKIIKIPPKYKYVRVPIKPRKSKNKPSKNLHKKC